MRHELPVIITERNTFWMHSGTVQAQLEEMNPEIESDGPVGEVGKVPPVIHTALTCCSLSGSSACASIPNSPIRPNDPNTKRQIQANETMPLDNRCLGNFNAFKAQSMTKYV